MKISFFFFVVTLRKIVAHTQQILFCYWTFRLHELEKYSIQNL